MGMSRPEVALRWLLTRPAVTAPIVGVSTEAQLATLLKAVDGTLEASDVGYLEELYEPRTIAGHL